MEIILQPSGNSGSREHYTDTISYPVKLNSIKKYLSNEDYNSLKNLYPDGLLYVWGVTPSSTLDEETNTYKITKNSETKWKRIDEGRTLVLFYANKKFFAKGIVLKRLQNKELAEHLWGINKKGLTWEFVYFVKDIEELHLSLEDFKSITGYAAPAIQGFSVMVDKSQKEALLTELDNFNLPDYSDIESESFESVEDIDKNKEYTEGERKVRRHIAIERNSKLINDAKTAFKKKNKRLYCEACEFDFSTVYGVRGGDYIEGHHTNFISDSNGKIKTKLQDIAMLCSNCHRMIHTKRPWLTVEELKNLIKRNNK